MLDRLNGMAVFVEAVRSGSFTAAAKKLDMSPQMVARHIAELERRVATRLLNRTTRKQTLTEFGRLYLETALSRWRADDALGAAGVLRSEGRRILGDLSESMPCVKASGELFAIERGAQQMSLEGEVLADRTKVREESLRALRNPESTHSPLAFTRRLVTVLCPVIQPGTGFDKDVLDVG